MRTIAAAASGADPGGYDLRRVVLMRRARHHSFHKTLM
jgi:hypothetical protein